MDASKDYWFDDRQWTETELKNYADLNEGRLPGGGLYADRERARKEVHQLESTQHSAPLGTPKK
jgi:hypothetical protein